MFQWIVQERIVVARPLILFAGFRVHFLSLSNFLPDMILVLLHWLQYLLDILFDFLAKGHPS